MAYAVFIGSWQKVIHGSNDEPAKIWGGLARILPGLGLYARSSVYVEVQERTHLAGALVRANEGQGSLSSCGDPSFPAHDLCQ